MEPFMELSRREGAGLPAGEAIMTLATAEGVPSVCGGSGWRPGAEWLADLPLVAERVDDPAESPAVLVPDA
jgi:hypothetical protein